MKIEKFEFTENEAYNLYSAEKYIVTYRGVYQLDYCNNLLSDTGRRYGAVYGRKIIDLTSSRMVKRGKYEALTAAEINSRLGKKVLIER